MTRIVKRTEQGDLISIDIRCDECGRIENDADIMAGGGLLKMGWRRQFADDHYRHICPAHTKEK